uniref:Cation/H+ exchanger transmembrane domain-containing protein n=1 Tax=Kalanchoe fedtschenkoi TaxID=63787 RepID=A0A7N1A813_KALFE
MIPNNQLAPAASASSFRTWSDSLPFFFCEYLLSLSLSQSVNICFNALINLISAVPCGVISIGGITGWYSVMSENRLPLGAFRESIFYFLIFPATTFMAASYVPVESFVKNLNTILVRGVGFTLLSFLIVSTGAAYFLPKLGISSLHLTDYLFVGAIFGSSNLFFTFEDICYDCTNMRLQLEIATAEGVFSALTTQLLLSLIKALSSATFGWGFVLRGAPKIIMSLIISPLIMSLLIGVWFGRIGSREMSIEKTKQDLQDNEIRPHIFFAAFIIYSLAEWVYLNGILTAFMYGIIMSHDHLPKIAKYVTSPWSFSELTFLLRIVRDWFLHYWVACSLTDLPHWELITSSSETYKTFVSVWAVLLILLIVGRLLSVYHLSRFVDTALEKDCEDAFFEGRDPEQLYACTSADLNRLLETATSARNVLCLSRFMPSSIALVVALSQVTCPCVFH